MGVTQYDPVRILNGFTIEVLIELARKLKRKTKSTKREIIQEILSHPRGKPEGMVKVWQEINRYLRKELEALSQETIALLSAGEVSSDEGFKVGYMLTLSLDAEVRALGEDLYRCRTEEDKALDKNIVEETVAVMSTMLLEKEGRNRVTKDVIEATAIEDMIKERDKAVMAEEQGQTMSDKDHGIEETENLHKRIRTLENRLQKLNLEGQRTRGQSEKLRLDMATLKAQLIREKEETGKSKNRMKELEEELAIKEKEIDQLKQKLEQKKIVSHQKTKEEPCGEIDFASYQGRKALIFAERDPNVDIRLNALGIIPIWAMEIDWNRPRRRMSTCQLVLYKKNDALLIKLDEIREIAKHWNIPCNELLNFSGRIVHD